MTLALGIDPGKAHAAVALLEPRPGQRPLLRLVRVIEGVTPRAWRSAAYAVMEAVHAGASNADVAVIYELNPPGLGFRAYADIQAARGAILQAGEDAGMVYTSESAIGSSSWAVALGLPGKGKRGTGATKGLHRLDEARRLVEMPDDTFRGLGPAAVDAAEAVLLAASLCVDLGGRWFELPERATRRKGRGA